MAQGAKKPVFYLEACYLVGLALLALANAFMEWGDFGMGMVVAPAYLIHLKLSEVWPFFTFGMAEYLTQAIVLILLILVVRRFKITYLFSFGTAIIYGIFLDFFISILSVLPRDTAFLIRLTAYSLGDLVATFGIALLLKTYITQESYDLFVKEVTEKFNLPLGKVKTIYDISSCLIAIVLSFVFFGFGNFEGIKIGSVITTFINGSLIGMWLRLLDNRFAFRDGLPLRKYFE